ncbi:AAA family ATPase [Paracoccus sp. SJTW-4]|uniref:bifunctional aminoglycoside phosphotransferase/ATP-binding protein n=1 Tax=Paracoccus sp. SJTW-4 TaxID=3078428 RepID=UPI0039E873F6
MDDQADVIAFLSDPATHGGASVDVIETHISRIFLAGDRAWKMKRAVRLPYADFSTPALRLAACGAELDLNRRTAPALYLRVRRLTRTAEGIAFDGTGELVDAVVEMARFDQDCLFDRMAAAGQLTPALIEALARNIANFHASAPVLHLGGADNMAWVLGINEAGFAGSRVFSATEQTALNTAFRAALDRHAPALDRRADAGMVRRCHGDLHLRNICLIDGRPLLFDCIEFNEQLAGIDVAYDLAFLLMDLWHRGLAGLANLAANRWCDATGDEDGFALLPFFMAVRAAVRAHVIATQAETAGAGRDRLAAEARGYFDLAQALLAQAPARLVALGGLSGSGKTTVAEALAPHLSPPPGARLLESDRLRKAMHGVAAETRLPAAAYAPEVSAQVYAQMAGRSTAMLAQGAPVVANGVHDREPDRAAIEQAARAAGAAFLGVWLDADPALLRQRVAARRGGVSDATLAVLESQLQRTAEITGWHRIDAGQPTARIVQQILALPSDKGR